MKRLIALALIAACNQQDAPPKPVAATDPKPAPPVAEQVPPDAAPVAEQVPPDAAPVAVAAPPDAASPAAAADAARDRAEARLEEQQAQAMADLLTADSDDSPNRLDSIPHPGADLAAQIEDVQRSGAAVAVGGDGRAGVRGDGSAQVAPAPPRGRIAVVDKRAVDDTTLTADAVLAKVKMAYLSGLQRCYRETLARDPAARGKLTMSLQVNETGRAVSVHADTYDAPLASCVESLMSSWRFPVPKDGDGEAVSASFELAFMLVPS